jgi:hypothetical protein
MSQSEDRTKLARVFGEDIEIIFQSEGRIDNVFENGILGRVVCHS